eukprot:scaffold19828_cov19-Tisochrysis_lutea.AAC.3
MLTSGCAPWMGLQVKDVDVARGTITVLSPAPGPLPNKYLVTGSLRSAGLVCPAFQPSRVMHADAVRPLAHWQALGHYTVRKSNEHSKSALEVATRPTAAW